jgi:hypothetical protein
MHFPPGRIPEFSPDPLPLESTSGATDEPPFAKGLSPNAWELLEFLHRAAHGGPPPPALDGFQQGYNELVALRLAMRAAERMKITDKGEAALRDRYLSKRQRVV